MVQLTGRTGNVTKSYDYDAFGVEREIDPEDPIRAGLNWYTYCTNNPIRYIDPSGLSFKNTTRRIARGLIANPISVHITQNPNKYRIWVPFFGTISAVDVFYAAGFKWNQSTGTYHARQDAWQQIGGFNDFYDMVFDHATSMLSDNFRFTSGDREFIFWVWKGDYLNLGAGAEMGIYSKQSGIFGKVGITSPIDGHWLVDTSLAMTMTLTLTDQDGNQILSYNPDEKQWWITGFNPQYQGVDASDLIAIYTVTFNDPTMYTDFYNKYGDENSGDYDSRWTGWDSTNYSATFNF